MKTVVVFCRTVPKAINILSLTLLMLLAVTVCRAQTGRVPVHARSLSVPAVPPNPEPAGPGGVLSIDFGKVPLGEVVLRTVALSRPAVGGVDIKDQSSGADPSPEYKYEFGDSKGNPCNPADPAAAKDPCTQLLLGFMPSDDHTAVTATLTVTFTDVTTNQQVSLTGSGGTAGCLTPGGHWLPLNQRWQPVFGLGAPGGIQDRLTNQLYGDFGDPLKKVLVNCYYNTNNLASYFNQFQSIYNAASGATTVNAQLGSLNFTNGMQVTVGTNPQISSTTSTPSTSTSTTGVPTLSSANAAQAAQNMLSGGTMFGSGILPLFSVQSNLTLDLSGQVREGVDIQKFNNTSITASNPSTHTFVGLEAFMQYNSSNNAANSTSPAGSIFLGGSYGYGLANHTYAVQNGFGGRVNYQLAQVSAGILINGVVKIAASRGFGPSQKYIDSSSMVQKVVNNFQTWSVAIAYQSSSAKSK